LTTDRFENSDSAYMFDGDDYIDISIDISETAYSVSLWFKATTPGGILSTTNGSPASLANDRHIYLDSEGNICTRVWSNETIKLLDPPILMESIIT
jgi:hypothetical protein